MRQNPINAYSLKWSLAFHGVLLLIAAAAPLMPGCRPREVRVPLDFTVVLEENLVEPNIPPEEEEEVPEQAPEPDEPEAPPEPEPPEPLPPPPDAPAVEPKKEEKKPEKPKPKPPKPKPKPEKPKPPKPKPFKKGRRVTRGAPAKPSVDFTKLKPVSFKPVTQKRLSPAEIARALQEGARPGTRNRIPQSEVERCVLLVKNALYEAWEQPSTGDAGALPVQLEIRLDSSGRIASYRIVRSSGSPHCDQTVLKAAARTPQIRGLSLAFLKQYEEFTVEFKVQ